MSCFESLVAELNPSRFVQTAAMQHTGIFKSETLQLVRAHETSAVLRFINKVADRAAIDLGVTRRETEREQSFWNSSIILMNSTVEDQWLDMVHKAKKKPNYGMRDLNGVMEERALNKLELVGPMVDSYLKKHGNVYIVQVGTFKMHRTYASCEYIYPLDHFPVCLYADCEL